MQFALKNHNNGRVILPKTLILCDCLGSQSVDRTALSSASGLACSKVFSALCTSQINEAAALMQKGEVVIACRQEQALFEELAAEIGPEIGADMPGFVDIRDRAGWSETGPKSGPKMAALVRDAMLETPASKSLDIYSDGQCLILGRPETTFPAAAQLSEMLSVTVLVQAPTDVPPNAGFDVIIGDLKSVAGTLGHFEVRIDALQLAIPGGRGDLQFSAPKNGGQSECDLILDLTGNTPLFSAPDKRDGYLRADPRMPGQIAQAVLDASQLVGEFEKPFYIRLEEHSCAHSRAQITGCSKCIDACSTGAILPDGDHVKIDPSVCAGCGACAALCPSGAITFDAPPASFLVRRIKTLAETYIKAAGSGPRLLVCDGEFGSEMISLAARFGRGLPHDVIPLEVSSLNSFGHAEMLAALGSGFVAVDVLLSPKTERDALSSETGLALAISNNAPLRLLDVTDPDALSEALDQDEKPQLNVSPILPIGNRRQISRLAATALNGKPDTPIPLPAGAPYGSVVIDTDACTLCLSCVSLCPSGALLDNPDMPQLKFQEDACLQCGLCTRACPEKAITLQPQLNLADSALSQRVLHEEEPFACISCGALFGVKSTIDTIIEKLAGKHPMFATSESGKLIQMCDKCRIEAQYHSETSPFQSAPKPKTRTTEDYLKRRDH